MFSLVQIHHGISCTDIEATKRVLRAIGFTDHQPGAPEPLAQPCPDESGASGHEHGRQSHHSVSDESAAGFFRDPETLRPSRIAHSVT